jgi:Protein of unknown function DUF262
MAYIDNHLLSQSTILKIYSEKDDIIVNPEYQRNGDIWSLEKRQLLIDSILNDYDIPKIYFHKFNPAERSKSGKQYAIIDGRQRLETIWKFIEGEFALADDFQYLKDDSVNAKGFTYADLAKKYPKIKINFDSTALPVVVISTDDLELIEDMFSRLNEAVPLNAAEKRNAIGGYMAKLITKLSGHKFFKTSVNYSNLRYQHKDTIAKFLWLTYCLNNNETKNKIIDTKKVYLDGLVRKFKDSGNNEVEKLEKEVTPILEDMSKLFISKDPLLKAQGVLPIYFLLVRKYRNEKKISKFSRNLLLDFRKKLETNRQIAEKDISKAEFDLLEFSRLSQQGTNDANSIKTRVEILETYLGI